MKTLTSDDRKMLVEEAERLAKHARSTTKTQLRNLQGAAEDAVCVEQLILWLRYQAARHKEWGGLINPLATSLNKYSYGEDLSKVRLLIGYLVWAHRADQGGDV